MEVGICKRNWLLIKEIFFSSKYPILEHQPVENS